MDLRIRGLDRQAFDPAFAAASAGTDPLAVLRIADARPGFPCRVSLEDAEPGEVVLLTHFQHQAAATPFRASHAIYVRETARERWDAVNLVPPALAGRQLSLRAFDRDGWLVGGKLVPGADLLDVARELLANPAVAGLHAHYAAFGCYAAWVGRADGLQAA